MLRIILARLAIEKMESLQHNLLSQRAKYILEWIVTGAFLVLGVYLFSFWGRTNTLDVSSSTRLTGIGVAVGITILFLHVLGNDHRIWAQSRGHNIFTIVAAFLAARPIVIAISVIQTSYRIPLGVVTLGNLLGCAALVAIRYRFGIVINSRVGVVPNFNQQIDPVAQLP